ncbi:Tubulin tyrosine ligase [Aduncisulcus paluster]|uniref:Tubulin tyrosine ligase n=1 Tax=Aduncisulcus paluster TaxID=2918883 RepID=A0ABQ5JS33_9EUKA|nr:Tubulin tyrosine ligase [Aduncisulcus paluster]
MSALDHDKRKSSYRVCLAHCKYPVIHEVIHKRGWKIVDDESQDWNLIWHDRSVPISTVMKLSPWQQLNHFPNTREIARKDYLARNMKRFQKRFPQSFSFFPLTFVFPSEIPQLRQFIKSYKYKLSKDLFISKPVRGSQGKGIRLLPDLSTFPSEPCVIQKYISNPLLINGKKCDLRLYVIIYSVNPLIILLHSHGIVRFASTKYSTDPKHIGQTTMHLTNYSLNKHYVKKESYVKVCTDDIHFTKPLEGKFPPHHHKTMLSTSLKWTLDKFNQYLFDIDVDVAKVWSDIADVIIKTVFVGSSHMKYNKTRAGMCFEVLGFDIMLDSKFKPWLIEVNHSPSYSCDSELDSIIKEKLLNDVFDLVHKRAISRRVVEKSERKAHKRRMFHAVTRTQSYLDGLVDRSTKDSSFQ